jgi:WD40 repeat protein
LNITAPGLVFALTHLSNDEIVGGCSDGSISIYFSDGTLKQTLNAFTWLRALVSLTNDDIVSGSQDNTARVWTN